MSLPTTKNEFAFQLAPHQLSNMLYNAQGSCSPYVIPPSNIPLVIDSAYYPSVDCQSAAFYDTPRVVTGASGNIGIFGGYRQTQSLEAQSPAGNLPTLGPALQPAPLLNYLGCPVQR